MTVDFCAIDFETANAFRGSPCAVGLAKVIGGAIVETRRYLMRPPEGYDDFDDFNVLLHGITRTAVAREPRFSALLPEILAFAGALPYVAHNAAFDMGVIRDASDVSGLEWPDATYACTLVLSRRTWKLLSYSLSWAAEAAGLAFDDHHDPEADAVAAASIMLAIARGRGADSVDATVAALAARMGSMTAGTWSGCHRPGPGPIPGANADADPDHPFYGREIAFTGALASMTRADAWERVASVGGQPASGVTKQTSVLVLGYQDARKLRPGETLSAKARKAQEFRAGGREIELMGEVDFLQQLAL